MGMILNAMILTMFMSQAQVPAKEPAAQAEPAEAPPKSEAEAAREEAKKKDAEAKAIVAEFKKGLKNCKDASSLSAAINALGETQHQRIMVELRNWLGHGNADVVGAAVDQLVKYKNDKYDKIVAEGLLQAAKARRDKDGIAKCLAGVGDVGFRQAAPGLLDFLHNKDVSVCKTALESCGKLKSKFTIDRLIALARDLDGIRTDYSVGAGGYGVSASSPYAIPGPSPQQQDEINRKNALLPATYDALKKITGQNCSTLKEWDMWWRQNKGLFKELE